MYGVYNETKKQIFEVCDTFEEAQEKMENFKNQTPPKLPIFKDFSKDNFSIRELIDLYPNGENGHAYRYDTKRYTV